MLEGRGGGRVAHLLVEGDELQQLLLGQLVLVACHRRGAGASLEADRQGRRRGPVGSPFVPVDPGGCPGSTGRRGRRCLHLLALAVALLAEPVAGQVLAAAAGATLPVAIRIRISPRRRARSRPASAT
eukprot:9487254-Pyramimonas_sp.AAC.1